MQTHETSIFYRHSKLNTLQCCYWLCITSCDVVSDGLEDVAVGCPGCDGGAGAVFVYHGQQAPYYLQRGEQAKPCCQLDSHF